MNMEAHLEQYREQTTHLSTEEMLYWAVQHFPGNVVFSSSFGAEDMVLHHLIHQLNLPITIITLDTGRLPPETYELMETVRKTYPHQIEVYFPDAKAVEELTCKKGFFSFRESIENRKECCHIRKIEPLTRALAGKNAWITGIRKSQSTTRTIAQKIEYDQSQDILKINPLVNWEEEQVWQYLREKKIPYNRLHDQGYPSIGCQPCTRAIKPGEDLRAGRWWWEKPEQKECGLHQYSQIKSATIKTNRDLASDAKL